jgi:hypothetical protein
MCFSASASFGAGTMLFVVGVLALKKTRKPSQVPFGAIPMLFSIQQFAEGFVWLSLTNKSFETLESYATNIFLVFAQVLWPILVPLSIFFLEKNTMRKKILGTLAIMGTLMAIFLIYCLFNYYAKAEIGYLHIHYQLNYPMALSWISGLIYFMPTVVPNFISSIKRISLLGFSIALSYIFTLIFYRDYLISVWCFFTAIQSGIVLYIVTKMNPPFSLKLRTV